jgi:hypothetical protein
MTEGGVDSHGIGNGIADASSSAITSRSMTTDNAVEVVTQQGSYMLAHIYVLFFMSNGLDAINVFL